MFTISTATLADRGLFLILWREYMKEMENWGGPLPATDHNLRRFLWLFESYASGQMFGTTLIAWSPKGEPAGLMMGGESPPDPLGFEGRGGRCAEFWGVYVVPEFRREGVARMLQDRSLEVARSLGFTKMQSTLLEGYPVAEANALGWGAKVVNKTILYEFDELRESGETKAKPNVTPTTAVEDFLIR